MKKFNILFFILMLIGVTGFAGTPVVINQTQTLDKFNSQKVTLSGKAEIHLTNATTPMVGSSVNIISTDAWLYFDNMRPVDVVSLYKDSLFVNDSVIAPGVNCRIAVYKHGTVILPHSKTFKPLEVFVEPSYAGTSQSYALQVYNTALGTYNNAIQSIKLKKGYMATLANGSDGSGYSRCYIADKEDLLVAQLPPELNKKVSFIRVFPWEWVTKKGWGGNAADTEMIKGTWRWDWSASNNSQTGMEYVPIKEQKYWPSWATIASKNTATHLMGYCEPDNGENRSTVDESIAEWPNMLKTGLRLGTPSAINMPWIYEFIDKCDAKRYRVDYVTIHCYWAAKPASQWYKDLKAVYDRTKRPLWITEWNTGGNWTSEPWPTDSLQALQKQLTDIKAILNVLDTASFVERYSIYNWVENKRAMIIKNVLTPAGSYYANNKSVVSFNRNNELILNPLAMPPVVSVAINAAGTQLTLNWSDANQELTQGYTVEKKENNGIFKKVLEVDGTAIKSYKEDLLPMANTDTYTYRVNTIGARAEAASSSEMSVIATRGNSTFQYGNAPVSSTEWNTLLMKNPFTATPVVILGSPSYENIAPMTQSIRSISNNQVSFHLDPWVYLGTVNFTKTETVPYVMLPAVEQTIGTVRIQTGLAAIKKTTWTYIPFAKPFAVTPIVLPTLRTTQNTIPVTVRIKDVTVAGFWAILKQEQGQTAALVAEFISYIAATPGTGIIGNKKLQVGITPDASVGNTLNSYRLNFEGTFTKPVFLCAMQSYNDTVTSTLRYTMLSSTGVNIFKHRESSKSTTAVAKESAGWMLLEEADPVSGISDVHESKIVVYPNPAKDKLYISGLQQPAMVEVFNFMGQRLIKIITNQHIDISDLKSGYYLVKIEGKQTLSFMKQ